jgi:hypothetical protein
MNIHHPLWGGRCTDIDREAEDLLIVTDEFKMGLLTEEGKFTWERVGSSSVIDLTFVSETLTERLVRSGRVDDIEHQSDHYPIRTMFSGVSRSDLTYRQIPSLCLCLCLSLTAPIY